MQIRIFNIFNDNNLVSDKNIQKHILTTLLESCRKKVDRENIACGIVVDLPAKSFDTAEHGISGLFPTGGDGRGGEGMERESPQKLKTCSLLHPLPPGKIPPSRLLPTKFLFHPPYKG